MIKILRKEIYIIEGTGDLLSCPENIIAHQVNCQGVMGAGLAKSIKMKYPVVYENYRKLFEMDEINPALLLGGCQIIEVEEGRKWGQTCLDKNDMVRTSNLPIMTH